MRATGLNMLGGVVLRRCSAVAGTYKSVVRVGVRMDDGFLWGASVSPHQVEGGLEDNWTRWEAEHAEELAGAAGDRFGGLDVWDDIWEEATTPGTYVSGEGVRHAERYAEDFALAADMGLNAFRTGIAWSRVMPEPGVVDEAALEHYKDYFDSMHAHGLDPVVTLWHYALPEWFVEEGGWHGDRAVEHWETYVDAVVEAIGDDVTYWVTLNEPTAYLREYGGVMTVVKPFLPEEMLPRGPDYGIPDRLVDYNPLRKRRARANLDEAHRYAYDRIHAAGEEAMVGTANTVGAWQRTDSGILERSIGRIGSWWEYGRWVERNRDAMDFLGVNHFVPADMNAILPWRDGYETSDMGWPVDEGSLGDVLDAVADYDMPILVTEHGLADRSDAKRQELVDQAVTDVVAAREEHDVLGYLHWSFCDNYEWDKGRWPRWGLVGIDYENGYERVPRNSARVYEQAIDTYA